MFDLTKEEKIILVFLIVSFISGLGITAYKKSHQKTELTVKPYKIEHFSKVNEIIKNSRIININSLEIAELKRLPGVGQILAARIISYHKVHGPFKRIEELMQVTGIGEKKFAVIKDLIITE